RLAWYSRCCPCSRHSITLSLFSRSSAPRALRSFPTRRSSDLGAARVLVVRSEAADELRVANIREVVDQHSERTVGAIADLAAVRSEEHTSELQSLAYLVCRLLLEKKNCKTRE